MCNRQNIEVLITRRVFWVAYCTSQVVGVEESTSGSLFNKLIAAFPESSILVDKVRVRFLLDSGGQLFTLMETFYKNHLMLKEELVVISHMP